MSRTGASYDTTTLARRLVQSRLRYGYVPGDCPAQLATNEDGGVRFWDPGRAWQPGDIAIFPIPARRPYGRAYTPVVGEVTRCQGRAVTVFIDGSAGGRVFGTASGEETDESLSQWRRSVETIVDVLRGHEDVESRTDFVLWCCGASLVSSLLASLRGDPRFLQLDGQWYVRDGAARLPQAQLEALARRMIWDADRPLATGDLVDFVEPAAARSASTVFGLALSLGGRPDLFLNVEPGARPRWVLAAAPPGEYLAAHAAYDPASGEVLCEPGEVLSEDLVRQLWEADLLDVVVER
jgi:hypothetical protein